MNRPYFDTLETRDPELRERAQLAALREQIAYARAHAPWFARTLAGIEPADIDSRAALALPVVRNRIAGAAESRSAVRRLCRRGDRRAAARGRCSLRRALSTSPKAIPPTTGGCARALHAAGFRPGDLVHNCFSYHFSPAGSMLDTGLHALGCTVFPGGTGQTEQQVQAMADLGPDGYVGHAVVPEDHSRQGRRAGPDRLGNHGLGAGRAGRHRTAGRGAVARRGAGSGACASGRAAGERAHRPGGGPAGGRGAGRGGGADRAASSSRWRGHERRSAAGDPT